MNVKISVIMPSLNVVQYIEECMESILKQDMKDFEIICIDAKSTDGTREVLTKYSCLDNRIRIFDSPVRSYGYQVNLGIREARGEYISIIETDDYIAPNMLSYLYTKAMQYDADVSKADYYSFIKNAAGEKIFDIQHLFIGNNKKYYNRKITKDAVPEVVFYDDANIWCAIYRRAFLIDSNILLNESPGASFQDIGFMQQIHMFAKSMIFSDVPLYYYRTDRVDSSINNSVWLRNIHQEYEFIINSQIVNTKEWSVCKKLFVNRILRIYIGALQNAVVNSNFEITNVSWRPYYDKIKIVIKRCIDDSMVLDSSYPGDLWISLLLSIHSLESYRDYIKVKFDDTERKKTYLLQKTSDKSCIVFGSGARGEAVCSFLRSNGRNVIGFWDNDNNKCGKKYKGIPILKPTNISVDDSTVFVIAIRGLEEIITRQLKDLGGRDENIHFFNW